MKQRRKIAGFQRPFDLKRIIAEFHGMIFNQFGQRGFVSGDITQFRAVFERKRRRIGGVIEADERSCGAGFPESQLLKPSNFHE